MHYPDRRTRDATRDIHILVVVRSENVSVIDVLEDRVGVQQDWRCIILLRVCSFR